MAFRYLSQNRARTLDTFASIPKKSSLGKSLISLPTMAGEIQSVRLHTGNPIKFDASLYESTTSVLGDINNIVRVSGVEQQIKLFNQSIWFLNEDDPSAPQIWFDLSNDSNLGSGVITLSLIVNSAGPVSVPR